MSSPKTLTCSETLQVVSRPRRRYVLYLLLENERANLEELSLQIAAWERNVSVSSVDEDDRKAVVVALVHNHLPRLADADIVEYDARSGDVVRGTEFEDVRSVVERVRELDDEGEVTERSVASILSPDPSTPPTVSR